LQSPEFLAAARKAGIESSLAPLYGKKYAAYLAALQEEIAPLIRRAVDRTGPGAVLSGALVFPGSILVALALLLAWGLARARHGVKRAAGTRRAGPRLAAFAGLVVAFYLLLPVAALLLKILYWRRKKLYIEHLIFSLHVHAFIFSLLILTVILDYRIVIWGVILWSHVYLYLAIKNYYSQGYVKTFFKMALLLFSYGLTLIVAMTLTLVGTAVSLQLSDKM
jgi:hypothetical protein